jgi:DNA-binding NarL/FixJ family response regulator
LRSRFPPLETAPSDKQVETPTKIRVLLADDHPVVREGVRALIGRRSDMSVVAEASNGVEAVELFERHRPDVALIDLRMPGMDGVDAIKAIRRQFPDARIIVLTTFHGDEDIYRALRAGAKAYLLKDVGREDLLGCVRSVSEGRTYLPTGVAAKLAERVAGPQLTVRELDVLRLMGAGKSNKEIGADLSVTEGTIKAHVNSILSKLHVRGRTEAVASAVKRGIIQLE